MKLEHEGVVAASRERVWSVLMDIPRAARLVPGMREVTAAGPTTWRGSLQVTVGPIRLDLVGIVELRSRDDERGTASLRLEAEDAKVRGGVNATTSVAVSGEQASTRVRMTTDAQILGRIGELGQPLIKRKADQIIERFLADLAREAAS